MNIAYPTGVVTAFYGRNPLRIFKGYQAFGVAPHGTVVRATYTVPLGRRAVVTSCVLHVNRVTVAAPVGQAVSAVELNQGGLTQYVAKMILYDNAVGANKDLPLSGEIWLTENDFIRLVTIDGSTGGTCDYILTLNAMEYDP